MANSLPATYNLPKEVKQAARQAVAYLIFMCPGWVSSLHVDFDSNPSPEDQGTMATMRADYAYRRVYLTIFPRWLWENEDMRKSVIICACVAGSDSGVR
jgi:hypothetical protein